MDRRNDATTPIDNVVPLDLIPRLGRLDAGESDATLPLAPLENCTCMVCRAFVSPWALDQLEIHIMDLVADLLDAGWEPERLVDEVARCANRGPNAENIVTLALVSHAGYWMSILAMFDLLGAVDELAAGFNHLVGLTVPGWLRRYATDDVEYAKALGGVADVFEILPALARPPAGATRATQSGSVWDAWLPHRP